MAWYWQGLRGPRSGAQWSPEKGATGQGGRGLEVSKLVGVHVPMTDRTKQESAGVLQAEWRRERQDTGQDEVESNQIKRWKGLSSGIVWGLSLALRLGGHPAGRKM